MSGCNSQEDGCSGSAAVVPPAQEELAKAHSFERTILEVLMKKSPLSEARRSIFFDSVSAGAVLESLPAPREAAPAASRAFMECVKAAFERIGADAGSQGVEGESCRAAMEMSRRSAEACIGLATLAGVASVALSACNVSSIIVERILSSRSMRMLFEPEQECLKGVAESDPPWVQSMKKKKGEEVAVSAGVSVFADGRLRYVRSGQIAFRLNDCAPFRLVGVSESKISGLSSLSTMEMFLKSREAFAGHMNESVASPMYGSVGLHVGLMKLVDGTIKRVLGKSAFFQVKNYDSRVSDLSIVIMNPYHRYSQMTVRIPSFDMDDIASAAVELADICGDLVGMADKLYAEVKGKWGEISSTLAKEFECMCIMEVGSI